MKALVVGRKNKGAVFRQLVFAAYLQAKEDAADDGDKLNKHEPERRLKQFVLRK